MSSNVLGDDAGDQTELIHAAGRLPARSVSVDCHPRQIPVVTLFLSFLEISECFFFDGVVKDLADFAPGEAT